MQSTVELSPQQLAESCAALMYERDLATRALGMVIDTIVPGEAVLSMIVSEVMIQGHDSCHGGYIFTLADSAFAFACNTYNAVTVGQACTIDYIAPAKLGDRLTATVKELSRGKRTGVYDVSIVNQRAELLATFRGRSYQVQGVLMDERELQSKAAEYLAKAQLKPS